MTEFSIKEMRIEKGWSIAELSKRSKVTRKTIYRIEHNKVTPRDYTLSKLKRALEEV